MKTGFAFFMFLFVTVRVLAQSPDKMSYQCVIRNSSGALVINQNVGIKISILRGTASGTVIYQETYSPNPQTNANGLISIEIGGGLAILGTFSEIDWASGPYFLMTETDPTGGTNYTIVGTTQLLSVPYALYAKTAGSSFSGNYNDLINIPILFNGSWTNITGKPNTLAGYGITDGMNTSHPANGITSTLIGNWSTAFSWGNHAGLYRPVSYVPLWSEITNKPTTVEGYGITDAVNTTGNQSIAGNKTFTGKISAASQNITNVANPVSAQDVATKDYVDGLQTQMTMLKNTLNAGGLITDIDGNIYNTVKIGNQVWMAENLKTTKFNDGTPIPQVTESTAWSNLSTPGYCWYNNDINYKNTYGAIYNYYVFENDLTPPSPPMDKKLCPTGWHLPNVSEWKALMATADPEYDNFDHNKCLNCISFNAGAKLKEAGTIHWQSTTVDVSNETGFTALPGGSRVRDGSFKLIGQQGTWWMYGNMFVSMSYMSNDVGADLDQPRKIGHSVRCLKD